MNNSTMLAMFEEGTKMLNYEIVVWSVLFSIEAALIVGENVFTVIIFANTNLRQTRAFYFLLNLSIADLMVGALSIPLFVNVFTDYFSGIKLSESVYTAHRFVEAFTGFIAIFSLALVSLERLYAIVFPLRHRTTKKRSYIYSGIGTWLLAMLVPCLGCIPAEITRQISFYSYFIFHTTALLVICVAYLVVWISVTCNHVKTANRPHDVRDRRLARTLAMVTGVSLVAWVPFQLIYYLQTLCSSCGNVPNTPLYLSKLMHYGNSLVNPILYSFRIPDFNKTAKRLLRMRRKSRHSVPIELKELVEQGACVYGNTYFTGRPSSRHVSRLELCQPV